MSNYIDRLTDEIADSFDESYITISIDRRGLKNAIEKILSKGLPQEPISKKAKVFIVIHPKLHLGSPDRTCFEIMEKIEEVVGHMGDIEIMKEEKDEK